MNIQIKGRWVINLIILSIIAYFTLNGKIITDFCIFFLYAIFYILKWGVLIIFVLTNLFAFIEWLDDHITFKEYKIKYDIDLSPFSIIIVPVLWIPYLFHCIYTFADKHLTFKI